MNLAESYSRLGSETAFEMLARSRALEAKGRTILHFEVGEPDFPTPDNIRRAAQKALDEGWTRYGPAHGLPQARAAVAEYVSRTRGVAFAPEETILVPGGKPIIFFTVLALIDPGDEVIYPNPGFPIYESMINYVNGKAVPLPLREETAFEFNPDEFERLLSPKTKLVILNSPSNPTGGVMSKRALERVAAALEKFPQTMVLSDEIYSRILFEGRHLSLAALPGMKDRCIILDGFSKTWSMTGWRLGFGVGPRWLIDAIAKLATNDHSCAASFAQIAGIEALSGPQDAVREMVAELRRRRDFIVSGLNSINGIECPAPSASFYAFPNIRATGWNSRELSDMLLDRAGVACLPGTAFGRHGDGYLRLSYANSMANIELALNAIRKSLADVPPP